MKNTIKEILEKHKQGTLSDVEAEKILVDLYSIKNSFPMGDKHIRAYGLLQKISKAEMSEDSAYTPENDLKNKNIEMWKEEYYELLN